MSPRPTLSKVALVVSLAAAAAAAGALPAAWLVDRIWGRDVVLIVSHDAASVEVNRTLWLAGEPVPDLYGNAVGARVRVLAPDPARVIVPAEDPALVLLAVDKAAGENPLQAQTVWFVARHAATGLAAVTFAALLAWQLLRRSARHTAPARRAHEPAPPHISA